MAVNLLPFIIAVVVALSVAVVVLVVVLSAYLKARKQLNQQTVRRRQRDVTSADENDVIVERSTKQQKVRAVQEERQMASMRNYPTQMYLPTAPREAVRPRLIDPYPDDPEVFRNYFVAKRLPRSAAVEAVQMPAVNRSAPVRPVETVDAWSRRDGGQVMVGPSRVTNTTRRESESTSSTDSNSDSSSEDERTAVRQRRRARQHQAAAVRYNGAIGLPATSVPQMIPTTALVYPQQPNVHPPVGVSQQPPTTTQQMTPVSVPAGHTEPEITWTAVGMGDNRRAAALNGPGYNRSEALTGGYLWRPNQHGYEEQEQTTSIREYFN